MEELGDRLEEVPVGGERLLAVGDTPLGPEVDRVRGDPAVLDRPLASLGEHRSELAELVVGVFREDLGERREPRRD